MTTRKIVSALVAVVLASGCSDGRSVEAYCEVLESENQRIRDKYSDRFDGAGEDPLADLVVGVASLLEAQGDIALLTERLAERAPEEVRLEHEAVAEFTREQADSAADAVTDPLGALAGAVVGSFTNSGNVRTVDRYASENCGMSIFGSL